MLILPGSESRIPVAVERTRVCGTGCRSCRTERQPRSARRDRSGLSIGFRSCRAIAESFLYLNNKQPRWFLSDVPWREASTDLPCPRCVLEFVPIAAAWRGHGARCVGQ